MESDTRPGVCVRMCFIRFYSTVLVKMYRQTSYLIFGPQVVVALVHL
jgi:hypothetical protein